MSPISSFTFHNIICVNCFRVIDWSSDTPMFCHSHNFTGCCFIGMSITVPDFGCMYKLRCISVLADYRTRKHERRRCSQRPKSKLDVLQQSWNVGHVHHHRHHCSLYAAESSIPVSCSCVDSNQCPTQCGTSHFHCTENRTPQVINNRNLC